MGFIKGERDICAEIRAWNTIQTLNTRSLYAAMLFRKRNKMDLLPGPSNGVGIGPESTENIIKKYVTNVQESGAETASDVVNAAAYETVHSDAVQPFLNHLGEPVLSRLSGVAVDPEPVLDDTKERISPPIVSHDNVLEDLERRMSAVPNPGDQTTTEDSEENSGNSDKEDQLQIAEESPVQGGSAATPGAVNTDNNGQPTPESPTKRRRGRPPKPKPEGGEEPRQKRKYVRKKPLEKKESQEDDVVTPPTEVTPKKRGRKPKPKDPEEMVIILDTPRPQKAGRRGKRRNNAGSSSEDEDDEFERMTKKATPAKLGAIDKFHNGIIEMTTHPEPKPGPGLALLPFTEIYKAFSKSCDPGYEVITFPNDSTIFT